MILYKRVGNLCHLTKITIFLNAVYILYDVCRHIYTHKIDGKPGCVEILNNFFENEKKTRQIKSYWYALYKVHQKNKYHYISYMGISGTSTPISIFWSPHIIFKETYRQNLRYFTNWLIYMIWIELEGRIDIFDQIGITTAARY